MKGKKKFKILIIIVILFFMLNIFLCVFSYLKFGTGNYIKTISAVSQIVYEKKIYVEITDGSKK